MGETQLNDTTRFEGAMIDIDETVRRLYKNPYEHEGRAERVCANCGDGIYAGEDYYRLGDRVYCQRCVEYGKRY